MDEPTGRDCLAGEYFVSRRGNVLHHQIRQRRDVDQRCRNRRIGIIGFRRTAGQSFIDFILSVRDHGQIVVAFDHLGPVYGHTLNACETCARRQSAAVGKFAEQIVGARLGGTAQIDPVRPGAGGWAGSAVGEHPRHVETAARPGNRRSLDGSYPQIRSQRSPKDTIARNRFAAAYVNGAHPEMIIGARDKSGQSDGVVRHQSCVQRGEGAISNGQTVFNA